MKNTLVVVADLACFKAYRVEDGVHRTPRLELLERYDRSDAHEKLVDKVSDLSGRFPNGASTGMSQGERHNIELESRKRLVKQIAQRLNHVGKTQESDQWLFAASKEINKPLLEALDPQVRAKIQRNIPADLTKIDKSELLRRFQVE